SDISNTEEVLCTEGHEQTQNKGKDWITLQVGGVDVGDVPVHQLFDQNTYHEDKDEEENDFDKNHEQAVAGRTADTGDDGQRNQTEHVVDQSSSQNGVTDNGGQFSHLLEGFNGDGNRGGGQDNADKDI